MEIPGYEIVRLLGKGGMSEVYEAENVRLGSRHAIKVYAYPKDDADVRRRFEQEGRLLAKLRHPRIVGVTDIGTTDDGHPYFVMDLVLNPEGRSQTLADVPDGEVDEATIGRWYDDMRDGLAYIHGKGVVHRDLKLQNVLIGPDGHAVLTDFGVSRIFDPAGGQNTLVDTVQTLVGIREGRRPVMGSLGYMAPELELGVAASPQSDWYALGVIVYKLLTGTWCDARTDVRAMLESYDPAWLPILPALLHANPVARECHSFRQAHEQVCERQLAAGEEARWREKARARRARHLARLLLAVALLAAGGLGTGWALARAECRGLRARLDWYGGQPKPICFDAVVRIPAAARAEPKEDARGNVVMPSREQFEQSRDDAYVLLRPVFSGLQTGTLTIEKAIGELERLAEELGDDSDRSPFDDFEFGGSPYLPVGENRPLQMLLEEAVKRLRELAET
ncbi:MAG: protein kinase [Kiritimatiellia bacterium]